MLGDGEQYSRLSVLGSETKLWRLGAELHTGDVGKQHGSALIGADNGVGNVGEACGVDVSLDDIFVAIFIEDTTANIVIDAGCSLFHLFDAHIVVLHAVEIEENLVFLNAAANHLHFGNATKREEARADSAVGDGAEVVERSAVGSKTHNKHLAENRRLRTKHRLFHAIRKLA